MKIIILGKTILAILFLIIQAGCGSTQHKTYDDDYTKIQGFKNGSFTYMNQGADFVIQGRINDGQYVAKLRCGERQPIFYSATERTGQDTMLMPQTQYHSGSVAGAYYSGTTQSTVPVSYSTSYVTVGFYCADLDVKQLVYNIKAPENSAPSCVRVKQEETPGEKRIRTVAALDSSEDCLDKQGWLRFSNDNGSKYHVFYGEKGGKLCKRIEDEMIKASTPNSETNLFLRKRLVCN